VSYDPFPSHSSGLLPPASMACVPQMRTGFQGWQDPGPLLARTALVFGPAQHSYHWDWIGAAGPDMVEPLGVTQGECSEQASPFSCMFLYLTFASPAKSCTISQKAPLLNRITSIEETIAKGLLVLGVYTMAIPLSGRSLISLPRYWTLRTQWKVCLAEPTTTGKLYETSLVRRVTLGSCSLGTVDGHRLRWPTAASRAGRR
jgi:hypothetical protein